MLDPWTALSLAASIVQFIDFSVGIVSDAKEIQKGGKSLKVLAIESKRSRLISLCDTIRKNQFPESTEIGFTDAEQVSIVQDFRTNGKDTDGVLY